ncbi:unnamed protein product [Discosporangium mesarthrocarpum]
MPRPRVFSMQKLVASLNMNIRSRIDWAIMWRVLAEHFGKVGCMEDNPPVAMYTVDCLRQLALKFLEKDELRDFNFQRVFLGPFDTIIRTSPQTQIRELVIRCLNNVTLAKGPLIRSGWKTILTVLRAAARDKKEEVVQMACTIVDRLMVDSFSQLQHDFIDLVYTLLEMAACRQGRRRGFPSFDVQSVYLDVSLSCIGHLRSCARFLATGGVDRPLPEATMTHAGQLPPEAIEAARKDHGGRARQRGTSAATPSTPPQSTTVPAQLDLGQDLRQGRGQGRNSGELMGVGEGEGDWGGRGEADAATEAGYRAQLALELWWPLLAGLAGGAGDPRLDCRSAAVSTLRDILREFGSCSEFSVGVWPCLLVKVLLPPMRHTQSEPVMGKAGSCAGGVRAGAGLEGSPGVLSAPVSAFPAQEGMFPLDMDSWTATTAPQLLRAATEAVSRNLPSSGPLGVPTLLGFLLELVRRGGCGAQGGNQTQGDGRGGGQVVAEAQAKKVTAESRGLGEVVAGYVGTDRKGLEGRLDKDAGSAAMAATEAAGASGSAVLGEVGVQGGELTSRMALEAVGQLVEALTGSQVPLEVWFFLGGGLSSTLHQCLPAKFGKAGRVCPRSTARDTPAPAPAPALPLVTVSETEAEIPPMPVERMHPEVTAGQKEGQGQGSSISAGSGPALATATGHTWDARVAMGGLVSALRLQRLLYGVARLHLGRVQGQVARVLLEGLAEGSAYARAFQRRNKLRVALLAMGFMVPESGPQALQLPNLLDQEREATGYILAISFRLLGVNWSSSTDSANNTSTDSGRGGEGIGDDGGKGNWPTRKSLEAAKEDTGRFRPRSTPRGGTRAGTGGLWAGGGTWGLPGIGVVPGGSRKVSGVGPTLVIDDLLSWSLGRGAGEDGSGGTFAATLPCWDGTELGREFLRREGEALLERYMEVDGEFSLKHSRWVLSILKGSVSVGAQSDPSLLTPPDAPSQDMGPPPSLSRAEHLQLQSQRSRLQSTGSSTSTSITTGTTHTGGRGAGFQMRRGGGAGGGDRMTMDLSGGRREESRHLVPLTLLLLRGLRALRQDRFEAELPWVYPRLVDLTVAKDPGVRLLVRELLGRRVANVLPFKMARGVQWEGWAKTSVSGRGEEGQRQEPMREKLGERREREAERE